MIGATVRRGPVDGARRRCGSTGADHVADDGRVGRRRLRRRGRHHPDRHGQGAPADPGARPHGHPSTRHACSRMDAVAIAQAGRSGGVYTGLFQTVARIAVDESPASLWKGSVPRQCLPTWFVIRALCTGCRPGWRVRSCTRRCVLVCTAPLGTGSGRVIPAWQRVSRLASPRAALAFPLPTPSTSSRYAAGTCRRLHPMLSRYPGPYRFVCKRKAVYRLGPRPGTRA